MERLQQYKIPLLTALGVIVVVVVVFLAWISPEGSKVSNLRSEQTQLQGEQTQLQIRIASLKREKADLGPTCATLTKDVTAIPGAPDVDSFLQQVTALAVASGDPNTPSISITQAAASTGTAAGVTTVAVQLTMEGTYGQMSDFLGGLYTFPRYFTISSVSVSGGSVSDGGSAPSPSTPNYSLSLSGNIYYSTGQSNICATSA